MFILSRTWLKKFQEERSDCFLEVPIIQSRFLSSFILPWNCLVVLSSTLLCYVNQLRFLYSSIFAARRNFFKLLFAMKQRLEFAQTLFFNPVRLATKRCVCNNYWHTFATKYEQKNKNMNESPETKTLTLKFNIVEAFLKGSQK